MSPAPLPQEKVRRGSGSGRHLAGVALVGGGVLLFLANLPIFLIIAALVGSVLVHESGHFIAAKAVGMDVSTFSIGFGPRIWSFKRGETEYGLRAIPLGGYVKVLGMVSDSEARPGRGYKGNSLPKKLTVVFAGSAAQILVAFALLWGWLATTGTATPATGFEVVEVIDGSAADQAGILPGDTVVAVDGQAIRSAEALPRLLRASASETSEIALERPNVGNLTVGVSLGDDSLLGVAGGTRYETHSVGVLPAGREAATTSKDFAVATAEGVTGLFKFATISNLAQDVANPSGAPTSLTPTQNSNSGERTAEQRVVSMIGIVHIGAQSIENNTSTLVPFIVSVNIFVALFNLLPVPPLDGGHAVIAIYERIRSRSGLRYEANPRIVNFAAIVVVLILGSIALGAMFVDVASPISLDQ